jgi:hypothetical protein
VKRALQLLFSKQAEATDRVPPDDRSSENLFHILPGRGFFFAPSVRDHDH